MEDTLPCAIQILKTVLTSCGHGYPETMKTVLLMRHSHAASNNPAWTDHDRPLSEQGRDVARRTGDLLTECSPDVIIHSTAVRAQETAEAMRDCFVSPPKMVALNWLYLAPAARYFEAASQVDIEHSVALIIGHNPGMAEAIHRWSGESLGIQPCSVAIFESEAEDWAGLSGNSSALPKLIGFISEAVRVR